jgi:NADH-quinone oxidoreductase subunit N
MMPTITPEIARQLMPLILLTAGSLVLLAWSAVSTRTARAQGLFAALVGVATLFSIPPVWNMEAGSLFNGMLIVDHFGLFFTALCVVAMIGTILISDGYLRRFDLLRGEYYALLLLTTAGMFVLVTASDLMSCWARSRSRSSFTGCRSCTGCAGP